LISLLACGEAEGANARSHPGTLVHTLPFAKEMKCNVQGPQHQIIEYFRTPDQKDSRDDVAAPWSRKLGSSWPGQTFTPECKASIIHVMVIFCISKVLSSLSMKTLSK